jgi:Family of unknown function (DUF6134)
VRKVKMKKIIIFACLTVSPILHAKEWAFDVYLDKSKIGTHTFTLNDNTLVSKAKFNVKVLFIEAYKYDHSAKEQWQGDCLTSLDAHTVENKVITDVKGDSSGGAFQLIPARASQKFPNCMMTFAYWNPKILEQKQLLNPQNAEYLNTTVEKQANETMMVKGKSTETTHYKLKGALEGKNKLNIELWYNQNNDWVALKSVTPEGYNIIYKLK